MKLTAAQKQFYLNHEGSRCPFCHSTDIEGREHDYEGNQVYQEIACNDCRRIWRDIYVLTEVEDIENEG